MASLTHQLLRIQREDAPRKGAMQLDADELQNDDEEEEEVCQSMNDLRMLRRIQ